MSDLLSQLILTDLQIANLDVGAIIAIDTPTVLLNAIDMSLFSKINIGN